MSAARPGRLRIRLRPGARSELQAARRWYEVRVPGLGRAFLAEVEATLAFVQEHPEMYAAVAEGSSARRALLHRFPYALVYEVVGRELVVLACFHLREEPLPAWLWRR